jgi:hypothetical protein
MYSSLNSIPHPKKLEERWTLSSGNTKYFNAKVSEFYALLLFI